jgi:arginine-tRNA-protein transferase
MEENQYWNYMEQGQVSPQQLNLLLEDGWRHFGSFFFRDTLSWNGNTLSQIIPLRINLDKFSLSKSQRKVLRKNENTKVVFRDAYIDDRKKEIFKTHTRRFKSNVPESIYDFLASEPAFVPCHTLECCLYDAQNTLYAVRYLDIASQSTSSVYAMLDFGYQHLSPGLHTLLEEIKHSKLLGKKYLYTGYAFRESSHYDYKKKFKGTEYYDWKGNWTDLSQMPYQDLDLLEEEDE